MRKGISVLCLALVVLLSSASPLGQASGVEAGGNLWRTLALPVRLLWLMTMPAEAILWMPVQGAQVRHVADTWRAPRAGGRSHAGQDIFARRDTPVYSATEGIVVRIDETKRGGKTVWVFGAGGRRYYYAHFERYAADLQVGAPVTVETILGYVGNTGNARATPPHLHLGVFAPEGAIDPLPLLRDRPGAAVSRVALKGSDRAVAGPQGCRLAP
jgi:murein DD-endopeptidase MepM/ murein hydrolase activator NlpD